MTNKAIILAGGEGKRMKSNLPKSMQPLCGRPMVLHIIDSVKQVGVQDITVVVSVNGSSVTNAVSPIPTVVQNQSLGTAHAALMAREKLAPFDGCVLILFGDNPLITSATMHRMVEKCLGGTDVVVLGFTPDVPGQYAYLVMDENGLQEVVEYQDATPKQHTITVCNSGLMCVNGQHLLRLLERVDNNNAQHEYYLPSIVKIAKNQGLTCDVVMGSPEECHGINTPEELAHGEEICIRRGQNV